MTPEHWKEVRAAFQRALEMPAEERPDFLRQTGDEELRREVESLLDSHARAGSFIDERSLFLFSETPEDDERSILSPGQLIGHYRIVRELGRGGMGAVYLAERADEQYEKRVAIKLIKRGMDTDSVLRHFRNERQILAGFDHPNIARLFDGGTNEEGLPYFVMEYIEGIAVDQYCDKHNLSLTVRLTLFREVCAAVSYAHRHLVVHRDIKRSNILVTADGVPKLLDFGIAKILQSDGAALLTMTGARPMTPETASPEQMRGQTVTTATDVYSLGVVLYELLTGNLPYHFDSPSPHEMARVIEEIEPKKPSTVVTEGENPKSEIRNSKLLRGDLDNIVLMALRKEPERRYQWVEQFSEDVRRYLEARPVLARKDTIGYRATKFVRRNKVALAAATLVFVSLLGGIVGTTWEAREARAEELVAKAEETAAKVEKARAERRFAEVRQLAHSLLFDYHDAIKDLPGATRVRERLVKDALANLDRLAAEAHGDPALQRELAAAYERVGDVRGQAFSASFGDRAGATQSYRKALQIREALVQAAPRDLQSRRELAGIYRKLGNELLDTNEAQRGTEYLEQSLAFYMQLAAEIPDNWQVQIDLAEAHNAIGSALEDRSEMTRALEHHRMALTIREELLGIKPADQANRRGLSVSYENIGRILSLTDDVRGALENNAKAMGLRETLLAEDPGGADYRRILSISYQNNGDYKSFQKDNAGALESFRKKLALDEQSYLADPANAQARGDLGYCCLRMGEFLAQSGDHQAAVASFRRAFDMHKQNMVADPKDVTIAIRATITIADLGEELAKLGETAHAREECATAIELLHATPDDPVNVNQRRLRVVAYSALGDAYVVLADQRAAHDTYQRALDIMHEHRDRGIADADDLAQIKEVERKAAECAAALAKKD